jgi:hypothetical protein
MTLKTLKTWPFFLLLTLPLPAAPARVVINEIFYHAPDDIEDLEFIELHNSSDQAVDLAGWAFTKGIEFKFTSGMRIEAKGFLVLCRNRDRFKEFYDAPVAGVFNQPLSNKGERIELSDPSGKVVDAVKFKDSAPWPMGADGFSGSLERISPEAGGEVPANWASSPLSENRSKPAGTPGKANASYSPQLPPAIANVKFTPQNPLAGEPIAVEADVRGGSGASEVRLWYRLAGAGFEKPEAALPMKKNSDNRYSAAIPGQATGQLIRFRIEATDSAGARRFFPSETEPRPALSSYVHGPIEPAKIPFGWIIDTTEAESKAGQQRARSPARGGFDPAEQARMMARFTLERGLDLPGVWFELTANRQADLAALQKLKPVFAAKLSEREKLIDETVDSANIEERLRTLPEVIKTFQAKLAESLKPQLTDEQNKAVTDWQEKQRQSGGGRGGMPFGNPGIMVRTMINLEAAWYAVSVKADIDEARFGNLRKNFQDLVKERNELADQAATLVQQEEGFQKLRDRGEALDQKVVANLEPVLTSSQQKQFSDWRESRNMFGRGRRTTAAAPSNRSAFVYFDPATRKLELFDFIRVTPRGGGQKVHFLKDRPLNRMSSINLIYEYDERFVLAEPLAYEVYRQAGMAAEQSYHVRLWIDGQPAGYYLLVEQPNRAFLHRNKIQDDGNLYKILWYEQGVVKQHEKKTHPRAGHEDIVALVDALEKTKGDQQWEVIKKNFNVEQVINYFAVNMVLSHWDGFFNNYFTYHDVHGTGKWTMYPWDQDKTWGFHDGLQPGEVFYDMPITFGMEGAVAPGQRAGPRQRGGFGGGGLAWWRDPGFFSGPLLANPQFRKHFLARTKEILETTYTEAVFVPVIDAMGDRLRDEVRIRAEILKEKPEQALQRFEKNLQTLREHLKKRREFLLAQDEIKNAGKFSRAEFATAPAKP